MGFYLATVGTGIVYRLSNTILQLDIRGWNLAETAVVGDDDKEALAVSPPGTDSPSRPTHHGSRSWSCTCLPGECTHRSYRCTSPCVRQIR